MRADAIVPYLEWASIDSTLIAMAHDKAKHLRVLSQVTVPLSKAANPGRCLSPEKSPKEKGRHRMSYYKPSRMPVKYFS